MWLILICFAMSLKVEGVSDCLVKSVVCMVNKHIKVSWGHKLSCRDPTFQRFPSSLSGSMNTSINSIFILMTELNVVSETVNPDLLNCLRRF
jgi:hypothetical protein